MALQVWLSLNGDLNNQGLKNVTVTNGEATIDDNGKIGKCYRFGTAKSFLELPAEAMNDFTTECTVSFWLKILTRNTSWATYFQAGLGGVQWNNYVFGFLRNGSGNKCCFTVSGEAGTSSGSFVTSDMELDTWYHITLVYQTGHCLIYMNGMLYHDYPTEIVPAFNNITTITIGCANTKTSYQSNCLLNDFRIYDTALSPLEVKHLAQGLVLHYPLNRGGFGKDNLLTNTDFNGVSKKYTLNSGSEGGFWFPPTSWERNTEYTVSCRLRGNANMNLYLISSSGNQALWWVNRVDLSTTDYRFFSITFTSRSDRDVSNLYICTRYGTNNSSVGDWFEIAPNSLKLEKGPTATPWTPALSDDLYSQMGLDNNIEYDVSGYGRNGSPIGQLEYSSDTARYSVSTYFDGDTAGILLENLDIAGILNNQATISFWIKPDGENGYRSVYFSAYTGVSWSIEKTAGNRIRSWWNGSPDEALAGTEVSDGVWSLITIVKDGTNDVRFYINGEQVAQSTAEHADKAFATTWRIGRDTRTGTTSYKGLMSDFRIYATALSADDVRDLYSVAASVSNNGTLMASEVSEL